MEGAGESGLACRCLMFWGFNTIRKFCSQIRATLIPIMIGLIGIGSLTQAAVDPNLVHASHKVRLIHFAAQRNRSHFKLLKDPVLNRYFSPDFIWDVRHFNNEKEFRDMVKNLRSCNSKVMIGCYNSACTTVPERLDSFPSAKLPLEQCDPAWILRLEEDKSPVRWPKKDRRYFLDMRRSDVRQAIISLSIARAKYYNLDAVCFDNCYWGIVPMKKFPVSSAEWSEAFMQFYRDAGNTCREKGLKCIVNVATIASYIPDAFRAISPYVDGIMTEIAFHPNITAAKMLDRELITYEELAQKGKIILLIPSSKQDQSFALKVIRRLASQYDNIYLASRDPLVDDPLAWVPAEKPRENSKPDSFDKHSTE